MSARKNARYRRLLQGARTRIRCLITESWYRVAASSANTPTEKRQAAQKDTP